MARNTSTRLSADQWTQAAFDVFTEEGLDGIAIEKLAGKLNATKGSFYWHFENRAALIDSVLETWRSLTQEIIAELASIADPRQRMRQLFFTTFTDVESSRWIRTETDLMSKIDDPVIAAIVQDVTHQRLSFMTDCLIEIGMTPKRAKDGALQGYAMWIGLLQLLHATPDLAPTPRDRTRFLNSTLDLLESMYPPA